MRAMVLESEPDGRLSRELRPRDVPKPEPGRGQLLIRVIACGVCRTDLHIVDNELPDPKLPLILGHQIVGRVAAVSDFDIRVSKFAIGDRVGVPWLGWTDGTCAYCKSNRENLCDRAKFTGYNIDGGYAEFTVADERYCFPLPDDVVAAFVSNAEPNKQALGTSASTLAEGEAQIAPLLCAGMLGYRSYRKTGDAKRLGIYGFGNAAHLISQVAIYEKKEVYAFTRPGDEAGQNKARSLGAVWAGGSEEMPPEKLDAAIIFAPVGALVPIALRALAKAGIIVCGGIHMSDIPSFPYADLWQERVITSVANLTRRDGEEFLKIAPRVPVKTNVEIFPLEEANAALDKFRSGELVANAVLKSSA